MFHMGQLTVDEVVYGTLSVRMGQNAKTKVLLSGILRILRVKNCNHEMFFACVFIFLSCTCFICFPTMFLAYLLLSRIAALSGWLRM